MPAEPAMLFPFRRKSWRNNIWGARGVLKVGRHFVQDVELRVIKRFKIPYLANPKTAEEDGHTAEKQNNGEANIEERRIAEGILQQSRDRTEDSNTDRIVPAIRLKAAVGHLFSGLIYKLELIKGIFGVRFSHDKFLVSYLNKLVN